MNESALVSCEWLQQNLARPNQVILDATFFLPRQQRNAKAEYLQHIPGALFFDIDEVADLTNPLPHTLPKADQFADAVGNLGIDNNTLVIIYDNNHFFAAARVWWMFRVFGHEQVVVLDGGLKRWTQLHYQLDRLVLLPGRKTYEVSFYSELVFDLEQMLDAIKSGDRQILDARSTDSFHGHSPRAESDLQAGHIPGSINFPYACLTHCDQNTLLTRQQLIEVFNDVNVDLSSAMVTSCGSGVSAAVLALALYEIGQQIIPMYDGSWAEWSRRKDTPKQTSDRW